MNNLFIKMSDNASPKAFTLMMLFPIGLLFYCIVIMQMHAIPFWEHLVGATGIWLSVLLECIALWFWFHKKLLLGVLTSIMLVGGPLLNIGLPLLETYTQAKLNTKLLDMHEKGLKQEYQALDKYLAKDWAGLSAKQLVKKNEREQHIESLLKNVRSNEWELLAKAMMSLLYLVIVLLAQIHILLTLSTMISKRMEQNVLSQETYGNSTEPPELGSFEEDSDGKVHDAQLIYEKLVSLKKKLNGTWKEVSNYLEIPPSSITRIKNLIDDKPDAASVDMLHRVALKLHALR